MTLFIDFFLSIYSVYYLFFYFYLIEKFIFISNCNDKLLSINYMIIMLNFVYFKFFIIN
jgi:hypothetical protein